MINTGFNPLSSFTKREIINTSSNDDDEEVSIHSLHLRREKFVRSVNRESWNKFQSTLFIYEERNVRKRSFIKFFKGVSIHSLHLRREKSVLESKVICSKRSFNPLSSFTKREITHPAIGTLTTISFQSTLFIYEERNFQMPVQKCGKMEFQSTLFIYEERNMRSIANITTYTSFNPLSSFTKREMILTLMRITTRQFQSTLFIYEERNTYLDLQVP